MTGVQTCALPIYPFRLTENKAQDAIASLLLGERAVGVAEVGELLSAA